MKKNIGILISVIALSATTSCKKFLTQLPQDSVAPQTYYSTPEQLTAALAAAYSELGNTDEATYSRFLSLEANASNDEYYLRSSSSIAASVYNASPSYANFINCWNDLYTGIERANLLLENLDQSPVAQATKDEIRGETLFLRAYYHFILVSYWGDVPLKLKSTQGVTDVNFPRTPKKQVYAQIIKDMTTAEGLVNTSAVWNNNGRISKTGVEGVLSRVCLHAAGRLADASYYPQAATWAQKVISSGIHSLNTDYKQIFINESQDVEDIKECIWEVEFYRDVAGIYRNYERFGSTLGINNTNIDYGFMQGQYECLGTYYNLFGKGDLRRDWTITPFYYSGNDASKGTITTPAASTWGRYLAKWRRSYQNAAIINVKNVGPTNWPLLRYADVLLMAAEADNEVNGPTTNSINYVNLVRERAYGNVLIGRNVNSVTITNAGTGYTVAPTVTITGGGATKAATATTTLTSGKITAITITDPGAFYTSAPTVTITSANGVGSGGAATVTISSLTDADLLPAQYTSKAVFRQTIMDERSRELGGEGHRKLDLFRWGNFLSTVANLVTVIPVQAPNASASSTYGYTGRASAVQPYKNVSNRDTLFPIPVTEITLNPGIPFSAQNPGW
ncbi:putative outer membrane starch-binding protein [Mucilaginibacter gracilis]|uniref:Putative outer membrane starch-binding protein n=1 Tax=Mucilaginibacter gracilis TaxID=423350 RepID=A0A495IVI3_9SPHI|nr:RagB/SusD family nutrient uptake outer membrane protein [Mucilaginibacter gracilis]RKR80767.1 putative outer membrane starch-binding protein [Mucilaginibacter gracilis]